MRDISLYFHIPFCKARCNYCDFYSSTDKYGLAADYVNALKEEFSSYDLKDYNIKSIFVGGGTPSSIDHSHICEILELCSSPETTIEANPGTLSKEKLIAYKSCGVNRISMGLQVWQNHLLKKLGRIHDTETFVENYKLAQSVGFNNINIDLIFGIPGQTIGDWAETLENVVALQPTHLSCYSLMIEEGTPFASLTPIDDETDRQMYDMAIKTLTGSGFKHYEISNFAKPGFESVHNLNYWKCGEYLGFGAAAHSYFNSMRFGNVSSLEEYISRISKGLSPIESSEEIDTDEARKEFMILGLRLIDGVAINEDILRVYGSQIDKLISQGLLQRKGDRIILTRKGLDVANQVFVEFV